jgi:AcrR family transcriptional regulator
MTRRAGLDKDAVIEEAVRLVDEEGLEQLSLGRLGERLGVRVPSLYNHVAGLPGLRRDLAVYALRDLYQIATRATIGKARAEAIYALADAMREYARHTPGRYLCTLQAPQEGDAEWQELGRLNIEVVRAILAPYLSDETTTIHAIRGLRSIVQGFISLEMAGAFAMPIDLEASFHWLLAAYIKGLD